MCRFRWVYRYVVVWEFVCPGMCTCVYLMIVCLCTYYTHTDTPAGYMCLIKGQVEYEYVMVNSMTQCVYVLGEWWVTQGREFKGTMSYSSGMVARGNRLAWLCWGWSAQNFWIHGPHLPREWDCLCKSHDCLETWWVVWRTRATLSFSSLMTPFHCPFHFLAAPPMSISIKLQVGLWSHWLLCSLW